MHKGGIRLMMLAEGADKEIKCGLASRYFKRISRIPSKEMIIPEIEKFKPDVVMMDLDLYEKMDGIETSRIIRNKFHVPVIYFESYKPSIGEW